MTIPTKNEFAKTDRYKESRRLARNPWSTRKENKLNQLILNPPLWLIATLFVIGACGLVWLQVTEVAR